ncbi:20473_t:CDS:2, partial [Gigaspora margarita]
MVIPGEIVDIFFRSNNAEVRKRRFDSLDFYLSNKSKPKKLKTKELAKTALAQLVDKCLSLATVGLICQVEVYGLSDSTEIVAQEKQWTFLY